MVATHVPPTRTTLMMQHDAALTVRWGGVGVGYQRPHDVRP